MRTKKLTLGKYPYTYARVSVMRSTLLTKEDYQRLMKMSLSEIISFLQSSHYKKAIDDLAVQHSGVDLMEMALNAHLVNSWNKLKQISARELYAIIDAYLERADLWNMKTILRGIHTQENPDQVKSMLLPAGRLNDDQLQDLVKTESVEEFLKKLSVVGIKFEQFQNELDTFRNKKLITEIENGFDSWYYKRMTQFAKNIPSEGKLFKQSLEAEIEMTNILNILRLKRAGLDKSKVQQFVIGKETPLTQKLVSTDDKNEHSKMLGGHVQEGVLSKYVQTGSLSEMELDLGRNLLQRTRILLHQHPLSVDVILGYMFAKEIEVKNLKLLLKSRQLNLPDQFVEEQIIV